MFKKNDCTLIREEVEEKAQSLLEQMTLQEKVWMLNGNWDLFGNLEKYQNGYNPVPIETNGCPRLDVSPIAFSDGPRGVVMGHSRSLKKPRRQADCRSKSNGCTK